jgi:hypothetical protein
MPPSALEHQSALDASATPITYHRTTADGAHPYKRDLPDMEFHLLDTGHFALVDKTDEMVPLIRDFLDRKIARK